MLVESQPFAELIKIKVQVEKFLLLSNSIAAATPFTASPFYKGTSFVEPGSWKTAVLMGGLQKPELA